jgi:molybdopterin-containing oxidoreductase family iron-sulfur binding subunit
LFRPDPCLWDGRYANNPWLQECPRPLTKVVWDNPLLIAPDLAQRMALKNGAEVRVAIGTHEQVLPVWIVPGQAAGCAVALLGYGRRVVGHVGNGTGFDTYPLRAAAGAPTLKPTGRHLPIASTEHHNALEDDGHDVARFGTLTAFRATPDFLKGSAGSEEIYRKTPPAPVAWGMSVDLNACIGCNACVVACMAENNVPVVGKEAVLQEREMHWLRIDRYYDSKDAASAHARFQPVLCMHCEEAPCEMVCPVGATVHDSEGLNLMVYNRCVGTRFCSNNCPYKVRRFNYGPYGRNDPRPPAARNPDVTVRGRGVMEKCTFCVQRIAAARIAHDKDGVAEQAETACQAVCPTRAFTFGDLNRPDSAVVQRKQSPLDYVLLPEQNTHPRVTYEAHILNLNPDVAA